MIQTANKVKRLVALWMECNGEMMMLMADELRRVQKKGKAKPGEKRSAPPFWGFLTRGKPKDEEEQDLGD